MASRLTVQKFAKFWPFRGSGDQGVWKVATFTAKGTSLRESTSIEPFCVKIGWGVWPLGLWGKKSKKVTRGSHRNDVSPLTQGLHCLTACDVIHVHKHRSLLMMCCVGYYNKGYGVRELTSKVLQIQAKKFFLDVRENRRGRFIKISEVLYGFNVRNI